jgi:hypothetical protein
MGAAATKNFAAPMPQAVRLAVVKMSGIADD